MKIELRYIKHAAFASEETLCFSASVYINGERAGEVSNDGKGGANRWSPWGLEARLNEHAKNLPPYDCSDLYKDGEKHTLPMDAELLIGALIEEGLAARDLKRALSKRVLYTRTDKPGVYQTKPIADESVRTDLIRRLTTEGDPVREKYLAAQVLNSMPIDAALPIYRGA